MLLKSTGIDKKQHHALSQINVKLGYIEKLPTITINEIIADN
jgi:hypothetical protein